MSFSRISRYLEALGETRMRLDLAPTRELLGLLEHPERRLRSVIIAGTNGKGSVCAFLTSIACAAGIRVGTYTSPNLECVTERIAIDGQPMKREAFARVALQVKETLEQKSFANVSYYEFLTMVALRAFVQEKVALAIFEVGLGGRLDSTNALDRITTAVTRIDYDHTKILGSTLPEIAREKGAIMRADLPAVIAAQEPEAKEALRAQADQIGAKWIDASPDESISSTCLGLRGEHQVENAACALGVARALRSFDFEISDAEIQDGLRLARAAGRLERWTHKEGKEVWLDVAHNPGAAQSLVSFFQQDDIDDLYVVVGMLQDKETGPFLETLLPITKRFTFCRAPSPRSWAPETAASGHSESRVITDPVEALRMAVRDHSRILLTGSFYTVGAVRPFLRDRLNFSLA